MNVATQPSAFSRPVETPAGRQDFELHFGSLFIEGRGLSFPCDAAGRVEESRLSVRARSNYRRALGVIGREYAMPSVRRCNFA